MKYLLVTVVLWPSVTWAHDSGLPHQDLGWTLDPAILLPLLIAAVLFAAGWRRLRARSHAGADGLRRRAYAFACGWLILGGAIVSPLHEAGERSFAAHMLEHELIMLCAAPLLVLASPLAIMLWAFPSQARLFLGRLTKWGSVERSWRFLTSPVVATLLQAAALWIWHAPGPFDRALAGSGWHAAQHLSFLLTALLFWTAMLARHTPVAVAALCLVATSIITGALGALMAFATSPWYAGYARLGMAPFSLSPSEDQQLAGLLMWVPGGLFHAGAALLVLRQLFKPAHG